MSSIGTSVTQSVAATGQAQRAQSERTERDRRPVERRRTDEFDHVELEEAARVARTRKRDKRNNAEEEPGKGEHHDHAAYRPTPGRDAGDDAPHIDVEG